MLRTTELTVLAEIVTRVHGCKMRSTTHSNDCIAHCMLLNGRGLCSPEPWAGGGIHGRTTRSTVRQPQPDDANRNAAESTVQRWSPYTCSKDNRASFMTCCSSRNSIVASCTSVRCAKAAVSLDDHPVSSSARSTPSVFRRNLQCQPVRKWTPEWNAIGHTPACLK
jgi:hypothetical protein